MAFIRIKSIPDKKGVCRTYAYLVENVWVPGKGSRQKVKKFLGKVHENNKYVREEVFKRDNYTCQECGCTTDLVVDHIIPLSKGGDNSLSNLQTLCRYCNAKKRDL